MSTTAPYTSVYGPMIGRGHVERFVINSLTLWLVPYIAEYERQNFLPARSTVVPPTPESIHGDLDFTRFQGEFFPEIVVVVQPTGEVERHEAGIYASWYNVQLAAFVSVEGDQDGTRALADIYGTVLQSLFSEQGCGGLQSDGITPVVTRTRLANAYGLTFPDDSVRDILRVTLGFRVNVMDIVSDEYGPTLPPADPYAVPLSEPSTNRVFVDLIRGTPDQTPGFVSADITEIDGTVVPPVTDYEQGTVLWPGLPAEIPALGSDQGTDRPGPVEP